ncbi:MAG TPA: hypothetical protein VH684_16930 [Xanthobacteraceae bacterium]|jgi:hypothetical protein
MSYRKLIGSVALAAALAIPAASLRADEASIYPDWSGQWRKVADGTPRYDPSKPNGRGQQAPLKEKYRRIHEASMAEQAQGRQGLYLKSVRCIPMGMPYTMSIVFPFEFVITPKATFILYEVMTSPPRRIYTDGRDWPQDPEPTYTGYSIGRWVDTDGDGRYDLLEIETRNMKVPRIFDQTGIPFADDGQGVIKERIYRDKSNPKILHDEMTTIDNALTRPWNALKSYNLLPSVIWTENNCTEGNSDVVIGKDQYLISGDGYLMPLTKDQPPPDLRYFKK